MKIKEKHTEENQTILFYDDQCLFCLRFKQALQRLDQEGRIFYLSIYDLHLKDQYPELLDYQLHDTIHLIDENKKIHRGADALYYLVNVIPATEKIFWLLDNNMGQKALKFFYDRLNQLRLTSEKLCGSCKNHK